MLVDSFGREIVNLRISVTDRCNLRCSYCLPQEEIEWLPREEILTFEEIERFVCVVAALGIRKPPHGRRAAAAARPAGARASSGAVPASSTWA
jgi:hypothetical protein